MPSRPASIDTASSGVLVRLSWCSDRYCSTVTTPVVLSIEIANAAWPLRSEEHTTALHTPRLFPYTTLFRSDPGRHIDHVAHRLIAVAIGHRHRDAKPARQHRHRIVRRVGQAVLVQRQILFHRHHARSAVDRDRERRLAV